MSVSTRLRNILIVLVFSLVPTLALWAPFYLRIGELWSIPLPTNGMQTLAANFDGPLYLVVAKTFYNNLLIKESFSFPLPVQYYAAHFPFYPALIWVFGTTLNTLFGSAFGFPWGMLLVTLVSSVVTIYYFRAFISKYVDRKHVLWVTFLFSVFPARWLIVRSVGTPEPIFMGAILASIYHFDKKQYWLAGVWGVVAQLTKSPAILLFIAYGFQFIIPSFKNFATIRISRWVFSLNWRIYPVTLIPLALLGVFVVYSYAFDDFFAYFNSGDNIHLLFPPFQIFDYSQSWVDTHWLEEIIFVYMIGGLGVIRLFKQDRGVMAWFTLVFFSSVIFVSHRDVIRYSLPILPFLYVAFSDLLTKDEFKYVMILLAIPIYLFSLAFISNNVMPISDWGPLL